MTSSQQDSAGSTPFPYEMASSRRAQDPVLPNQEFLDTICSANLCNLLHRLGVVVTAVATNHEKRAIGALWDSLEKRGNEVLGIVRLLEDGNLLPQSRASQLKSTLV